MEWSTLVAGLIGATLGFVLQAFSGLLTDRLTEKRERQAWLRERRYEAYSRVSTLLAKMNAADDFKSRDAMLHVRELYECRGQLNAIGTRETANALRAVADIARDIAVNKPYGDEYSAKVDEFMRASSIFTTTSRRELNQPIVPEKIPKQMTQETPEKPVEPI